VQTPKLLVAVIAVSTSGCVSSSAKFPSQVKIQAVYMDEDPLKPPPPPVSCIKTWMPGEVKLSRKALAQSPNTYVSWLIVNQCERQGNDPDPTVELGKWRLEQAAKKDVDPVDPPFSNCTLKELTKTVPYDDAVTVTCKVAKNAAYGKYHYKVVITIGSYVNNKDTVIYIDE